MYRHKSFDFSFTLIFLFSNWYHAHLPIFIGHLHTAIYSDEPAILGHCVEDEQIQELK
jgi:hypothetical protein